jgi:MFS family permease
MGGIERPRPASASNQSALASLKEGFQVVGRSPVLLAIILVTCLMNLLFIGPVAVGIPALAATRFPQGAAALGAVVSALGAGSLIGAVLSGALRPQKVGFAALGAAVVAGLGLASLGLVTNLPLAAAIGLLIGIGLGYANVLLISSLQKQISPELRGRVMSLMLLGSMGASPLSNAVAGAVVDLNVQGLFIGAGLVMAGLAVMALCLPQVRRLCMALG